MNPTTILSSSLSLPPPPASSNPNHTTPILSSPPRPPHLRRALRFRCPYRRRPGGSSWDPNAESIRTGRFGFRDDDEGGDDDGDLRSSPKRRWWSDEQSDDFDEEFDPFDDGDDDTESLWDRIWIFKVFKAYGYFLPAIIASSLLATGPKAFLMALAIPLVQSAVSLAIEKVWGKAREMPRTKPNSRRKPFVRSSTDAREQEQEINSRGYKGGQGYQSWVSAETGAADKGSNSQRSSFGGWDELDGQRGSSKRQSSVAGSSTQGDSVKKGKLSRGRFRDVPLLLRLLIAVFPFLGSWTRLF